MPLVRYVHACGGLCKGSDHAFVFTAHVEPAADNAKLFAYLKVARDRFEMRRMSEGEPVNILATQIAADSRAGDTRLLTIVIYYRQLGKAAHG